MTLREIDFCSLLFIQPNQDWALKDKRIVCQLFQHHSLIERRENFINSIPTIIVIFNKVANNLIKNISVYDEEWIPIAFCKRIVFIVFNKFEDLKTNDEASRLFEKEFLQKINGFTQKIFGSNQTLTNLMEEIYTKRLMDQRMYETTKRTITSQKAIEKATTDNHQLQEKESFHKAKIERIIEHLTCEVNSELFDSKNANSNVELPAEIKELPELIYTMVKQAVQFGEINMAKSILLNFLIKNT